MNKKIKCPNCNSEMYFCIDEWGHTPIHLHCDNDNINIGTTSFEKAIKLISTYHQPNTYLEYYNNEIKILFENGELKIYAE